MPNTGDTLLLGGLGKAVGANADTTSLTRLGLHGSASSNETKLSDFYISAIAGMEIPDTTPDESTSATATVTFSNAGSSFGARIAAVNGNFTWTEGLNDGSFVLTTASDYTAPISFSSVGANTNISFSVAFRDYFNDHATNYNSSIPETAIIQNTGGAGPG